jgi:hypothetical protein
MSNITEAEEIPASSVVCVNQDMGVFTVQGSKSTCQYTVNFGPTIGVTPSCECLPWMKSRLLCKHFFAVFRHFPNWGFDKLSRAYTKQPHITLDEEVISISTGNNRTTNDGSPSPMEDYGNSIPTSKACTDQEDIDSTSTQTAPAQNPTQSLRSTELHHISLNAIARQCRETLHCAKNLTYLIQDPEILQEFSTSLTEVVSAIKVKIPADGGLLLEKQQSTFKKKRLAKLSLKKKRDNSSTHLPNLPKQQKRTHPYSSRVGSKAEMMKKMYQVMYCTGWYKKI